MDLTGELTKRLVHQLPETFLKLEREIRNIDFYKDENPTKALQEELRNKYKNLDCALVLDNGNKIVFETYVDIDTGFGHLHSCLLDSSDEVLIVNEAISDGLTGERSIVFDPNSCYSLGKSGNKVKPFAINIVI